MTNNRSSCGAALDKEISALPCFALVKIFGIETRLGVCEIPKIFTSAKSHTQRQIKKTLIQKDAF